jgi:hypothetical protein
MADLPNRIDRHFHEGCGHCGECRWWQTDPDAEAGRDRNGLCLHEELAHFELEVSADSGCNRFRPDETAIVHGYRTGQGEGI